MKRQPHVNSMTRCSPSTQIASIQVPFGVLQRLPKQNKEIDKNFRAKDMSEKMAAHMTQCLTLPSMGAVCHQGNALTWHTCGSTSQTNMGRDLWRIPLWEMDWIAEKVR